MVAHTSAAPKPTSVVQARYNEAFFPRPLHDSAFDTGNAWPLSGSLDPIDDDRLAGKKRRFAGKEKDGVGDFLRRGGAFDRDALEEVRFTLAAPRESVEHLGLDRPGATALTRTPGSAPPSAAALVKPSTACLLAV